MSKRYVYITRYGKVRASWVHKTEADFLECTQFIRGKDARYIACEPTDHVAIAAAVKELKGLLS